MHWNLEQIDNIGKIGQKAIESYNNISKYLGIKMHSEDSAKKRIKELLKGKETFMDLSRDLAQKAQQRERITEQPKEKLDGTKATLTIVNYLGGNYYFTADEIKIENKNIYLIEGKHSKQRMIPSKEDIKDALLKMILFTNLEDVIVSDKKYNSIPALKLTTEKKFDVNSLNSSEKETIDLLKKECEINRFKIIFN